MQRTLRLQGRDAASTQEKEPKRVYWLVRQIKARLKETTAPEQQRRIAATLALSAQRAFNKAKLLLWLTTGGVESIGFLFSSCLRNTLFWRVFSFYRVFQPLKLFLLDNLDQLLSQWLTLSCDGCRRLSSVRGPSRQAKQWQRRAKTFFALKIQPSTSQNMKKKINQIWLLGLKNKFDCTRPCPIWTHTN